MCSRPNSFRVDCNCCFRIYMTFHGFCSVIIHHSLVVHWSYFSLCVKSIDKQKPKNQTETCWSERDGSMAKETNQNSKSDTVATEGKHCIHLWIERTTDLDALFRHSFMFDCIQKRAHNIVQHNNKVRVYFSSSDQNSEAHNACSRINVPHSKKMKNKQNERMNTIV